MVSTEHKMPKYHVIVNSTRQQYTVIVGYGLSYVAESVAVDRGRSSICHSSVVAIGDRCQRSQPALQRSWNHHHKKLLGKTTYTLPPNSIIWYRPGGDLFGWESNRVPGGR